MSVAQRSGEKANLGVWALIQGQPLSGLLRMAKYGKEMAKRVKEEE